MDTIDNINRLLKERGMSGAELSRSLGLSTAVYSQWNKRKTKPSNKTIKKIAEFFEVPVSDLTGESEQKEKPTRLGELVSDKDIRLLNWFHSLPPEKQIAILQLLGGPEDLHD